MKKGIAIILLMALLLTGCGADKKGQENAPGSESLYVQKVEDLPEDFILGMDASCVPALEAGGVKYYDHEGQEKDVFQILSENGINYIRVRVWNDPYDKDGNGTIDAMDMEVIKIMSGTLNANYPYLIRAKNESAKSMNINLTDATLYETEHNGVFCSSVFTEFNVYGTYEQKNQEDYPDILAIGGDGSWHKLAEGTTLNPFRLYLDIVDIEGSPVKVEESAASKIRIKVWGEDGDATGIEDNCELGVTSEELGVRSEEYYDLQGRRVKNPTKGLYIINGKKVNLP